MSEDFNLESDTEGNNPHVPKFVEGYKVHFNEYDEPYIILCDRHWILDPEGEPLEEPPPPDIFYDFPPTPRQVSLLGQLTLLLSAGQTLIFGSIFACFGMIFVCLFVGTSVIDMCCFWGENGEATVTQIEDAKFSVNGSRVYRYAFSGHDSNGNSITGASYQFAEKFQQDEIVPLENTWFLGAKWKLKGTHFSAGGKFAGYFGLLTFLFPIIGVWLVYSQTLRNGIKRLPLLKHGALALATFQDITGTGTSINGRSLENLVYIFEAADGEPYEADIRTLDPDKFLETNQKKVVFYDSQRPQNNMIWEDVSQHIKYDREQQRFTGFTFRLIVFPIFVVLFLLEIAWFFYAATTGNMLFFS